MTIKYTKIKETRNIILYGKYENNVLVSYEISITTDTNRTWKSLPPCLGAALEEYNNLIK